MIHFQIYTARYQNQNIPLSGLAPVRITLGAPRMRLPYQLMGVVRDLAPPRYLFNVNERADFEPRFLEHLDTTGADRILHQLQQIHDRTGKNLVLLCFERVDIPGEWCHRLCVSTWFQTRLGLTLEELAETDAPPLKVKKDRMTKSKDADGKALQTLKRRRA